MDAMDLFRNTPRKRRHIRIRTKDRPHGYEVDPETRAWLERPAYFRGAGIMRAIILLTIGICAAGAARIILVNI